MSQQPCAVIRCKRVSRILCDCCLQNLCIQHLSEHNALLIAELDPLVDEINIINNQLHTIEYTNLLKMYREKLEAWRVDCHEQIEHLFKEKCQEVEQKLTDIILKQRNEIYKTQTKVMDFIHEKETTRKNVDSLTSTIRHLQKQMNSIKNNCLQINISPLSIDKNLINIKENNQYPLDLNTFTPIYKTINYPHQSWYSLASNDRFLLLHQAPNLCLLNRQLSIIKQTKWSHNAIWNMCWSTLLNRFIIIEEDKIYLLDEEKMSLESIKIDKKQKWLSCTSSDTNLFLTTRQWGSSIARFSLLPSIKYIDEWKSPKTCENNECIDNIYCHNDTIILTIINQINKSVRIELRSVKTFDFIWMVKFDFQWKQNKTFSICSINSNQWIMTDYENKRLWHISNDGKIKTIIDYHAIPYRICPFGPSILAVATDNEVVLHKL